MPDRHYHHHHHHYGPEREGYAYRAGEPGPGPNLHRLRRNTQRGKIAGVCAGLADYLDWRVKWLRLGFILATIFFFPMPIIIYAVLAVVMKPNRFGGAIYQSTEEERFWRNFSVRPKATFSELKHRFRALDTRVEQMEYAVTSSEYGLRKQFRDLERGA
ncbi:MAG TPA: envelope stress response membrane protein PspC [Parvularculaceae bacterium]|nr:envelope stress response membrane protein PspC [Parvularculaceae bacterium]